MASKYLRNLSSEDREQLVHKLLETQNGNCFICSQSIDLMVHHGHVDIDHIESTTVGGTDGPGNFAATHASCNRSKQGSDLRVARILSSFERIVESTASENRAPNLGDVLSNHDGGKYELKVIDDTCKLSTSYPEIGRNEVLDYPIYKDELSGFRYSFMRVPIEYIHHDDRINPRPIGRNLRRLVEEFYRKFPQLHVTLGWMDPGDGAKIKVFDGQHKAAAQVLLGIKELPVRVFINPDKDRLLTANTRAGTTLRQVAFDKSIQRSLGSSLLADRMRRYRKDKGLTEDFEMFSENDLVNHFKGESREMRRYVLDWVRNSVTTYTDNKLRDYIEYGGRRTEMPFSYSAVEKTFYSFFIFSGMLDTPFNHRLDEGKNPRTLEIEQIVELMNIVAETIYVDKFEHSRGIRRIENDVQQGKDVPDDHLRAYRMAREEVLHTWLRYVNQLVRQYFITTGIPVQEDRIFQYSLPEPCWKNVRNFVDSLSRMPLWINRDLSLSAFGGKRNYSYWQSVFETGEAPDGLRIMSEGINLMDMIKERDA